jgi:hypothetical protein
MGWPEQVENLLGATGRTFGIDCTYEPFGGSPHTVRLIFRAESVQFEPGSDTPILVDTPAAEVQRSLLTADPIPMDTAIKDTIVIPVGGVRYAVTESMSDGFGQLTLMLRIHT